VHVERKTAIRVSLLCRVSLGWRRRSMYFAHLGLLPSGMEMMRPSSMPPVPTAPVMPIRPLNLSCHLLGSNRIRIQQRPGFSTLGRTGQNNKHANNQDAEYCLDVHRRLPPLRLSTLKNAIDLRLLPRFHDAGSVTFRPVARRIEIKSHGSNHCKRGQRRK
jgi:hypothetical protein